MKRGILVAVASAALCAAASSLLGGLRPAAASVILDTIDGQSFAGYGNGSAVYDNGISSESLALPFSSTKSTSIDDVTAFIGGSSGQVTLGIMTDTSGVPSGTFIDSTVVGVSNKPITLSSLNWSIFGATTYWLAAVPLSGTFASWNGSAYGNYAYSSTDNGAAVGTGRWNGVTSYLLPEALITTGVPETSTWWMLLLGFAGLGIAARRRASQKRSVTFSAA